MPVRREGDGVRQPVHPVEAGRPGQGSAGAAGSDALAALGGPPMAKKRPARKRPAKGRPAGLNP